MPMYGSTNSLPLTITTQYRCQYNLMIQLNSAAKAWDTMLGALTSKSRIWLKEPAVHRGSVPHRPQLTVSERSKIGGVILSQFIVPVIQTDRKPYMGPFHNIYLSSVESADYVTSYASSFGHHLLPRPLIVPSGVRVQTMNDLSVLSSSPTHEASALLTANVCASITSPGLELTVRRPV